MNYSYYSRSKIFCPSALCVPEWPPHSSMVEQRAFNSKALGSIPSADRRIFWDKGLFFFNIKKNKKNKKIMKCVLYCTIVAIVFAFSAYFLIKDDEKNS